MREREVSETERERERERENSRENCGEGRCNVQIHAGFIIDRNHLVLFGTCDVDGAEFEQRSILHSRLLRKALVGERRLVVRRKCFRKLQRE